MRRSVFGPFEFDHSAAELRKHGVKLRLAGQPLRILQVLLDSPNEIVEREELQRRLWSGTTFVDFEHGLNTAMNKLRQTLSDSADEPRYVETVPGRGYRFIGDLQPGAPAPTAQLEIVPVPRSRTRLLLAITLLSIAAAGLVIYFIMRRPNPPAVERAFRFLVLIPGQIKLSPSQSFAVSPDGHRVVFFARGEDGEQRLWMQTLDSSAPVPLPGTESAADNVAFWSPDSKSIAFYADHNLKRTDIGGSHPRVIAEVSGNVLGGSWNRDGNIIFGSETEGISLVSADGGPVTQVTARDPERSERVHAWPTFLPDGRHFLYSRLSSVPTNTGVYAGSLDVKPGEQSLKALVATSIGAQLVASAEDADTGTLLFQRENTLFAQTLKTSRLELVGEPSVVAAHVGFTRAYGFFSSSPRVLIHRDGQQDAGQLAWFSREGKKLGPVGSPHVSHSPPSISRDGGAVATSKFEAGHINVWVHDVARDVSQRLTFDPAINVGPVWSPDGKKIAFSSARAGQYDLYEVNRAGSGERLIFKSKESKMASSWSADGRFLIYTVQTGINSIWVVDVSAGGGQQPIALTLGKSNQSDAALSPDSRWIAYVSDESGTKDIYVQPITLPASAGSLEHGPKVLVSRGGGTRPRWRGDGKELFYRASDGSAMSVEIASGSTFNPAIPRKLFPLAGPRWDSTSDGKRFLVEVPEPQPVPPFTVVLNWLDRYPR